MSRVGVGGVYWAEQQRGAWKLSREAVTRRSLQIKSCTDSRNKVAINSVIIRTGNVANFVTVLTPNSCRGRPSYEQFDSRPRSSAPTITTLTANLVSTTQRYDGWSAMHHVMPFPRTNEPCDCLLTMDSATVDTVCILLVN